MTDDVLRRLRAANPVPNPDRLALLGELAEPADTELRDLLQRAREDRVTTEPSIATGESPMNTTTDEAQTATSLRTPRRWVAVVAAAAVLALVTAIGVTVWGGSSPSGTEVAAGDDQAPAAPTETLDLVILSFEVWWDDEPFYFISTCGANLPDYSLAVVAPDGTPIREQVVERGRMTGQRDEPPIYCEYEAVFEDLPAYEELGFIVTDAYGATVVETTATLEELEAEDWLVQVQDPFEPDIPARPRPPAGPPSD